MTEGLVFRRFQKDDLPRISEFRKSFYSDTSLIRRHEPEYYEWKFCENPLQQGDMWLAEDGNILVGTKGIVPKRMKILGKIVTGAEMGDSFTHPGYQRRGIFTILSKTVRERALNKGIDFIYNTPDEKTSLPGYIKKLNHAPVPIRLRLLVKPLRSKQLFKRKIPFSPLASTLSPILSPIMDIASRVTFKVATSGTAKSNIFVRQEQSFPGDIDTLWERVSDNYDVMLVRTKDYLQWRYIENPYPYSVQIARDESGSILGYMVTKNDSYGNVKWGFIVDFLSLENGPAIFKKLLATSLEEFYRRKTDVVLTRAVKGSFYDKLLVRFGFFPYARVPLLCYKNELGNQLLSGTYRWHFTWGDSDTV